MESSDYPVGFYFELSFKGQDAAFKEVSGISKEMTMEEVTCGGENRFKYRLPTVSSTKNIVLKRALIPEGSPLIDWCSSSLDEGLANPIEAHDVSVNLLDADGQVSVMWTFFNAYPVKYSISDLKSQESEIVMESIELAYTYFEITPDTSIADLFA
ncbi:phage tail protein [Tenacibaculum tangerinum]|uniref:Phage tail protein n=1 Tax=Tenacibaculum tangerinum TaxID=3038772 RepID=A0ABY8L2M8_9FLAO|nr:phage tail protein [Tenacibaculum tangerinum]WGH75701.1 phage tail protein [Tenacibaculum tangerinum]